MSLTEGRRPYLLLILLCLALYVPGLTGLPPIDRDEMRFAQASKQMIESGDYVRIEFQNESRAKKPAGIYWLQAASAKLTGQPNALWSYRLPSLLAAMAAVLMSFAFGSRLTDRKSALFGAGLLASCFLLVWEAHQAKTDAMQLASVVAAQGALGLFYFRRDPRPGWGPAMIFWLAQAVGILIKGPVVPMISLLTIAGLGLADRSLFWLKGLRPLPGLILVAVIVAPWVWAISHATQGQFIGTAVKTDLLPKLLGSQESHGGKPGLYLLLALATFWPASLLVAPALPRAWQQRRQPAVRFLLAWIIPNWVMFEVIPTKLPHYILPVYPALALLAGLWLTGAAERKSWHKILIVLWAVVSTVVAIAPVVAPHFLKMDPMWDLAPLSMLMLAAGWAPAIALWRGRMQQAASLAIAAGVIGFAGLITVAMPRLTPLWVSSRIAEIVPADVPLTAAGFHEPSLVFLHGTKTLLTDGPAAAVFLLETPDAWAAIDATAEQDFTAKLAEAGREGEQVGKVDGLNYSNGRSIHITLWKLRP